MTTQTKSFSELGIGPPKVVGFIGESIAIKKILDKEIILHFFEITDSKYKEKGDGKRLNIQIEFNSEKRLLWTGSIGLRDQIQRIPKDAFPIKTIIKEDNDRFMFT